MAILPVILLNGTIADANEVMADFNEIYTNITNVNISANAGISLSKLETGNPAEIAVVNGAGRFARVVMSGDATITSAGVVTVAGGGLIPIGTILPFYDYNGALTFDNTKYGYCDGQVLNFTGIGPQTTPDLSGRYLIGFGTVGGGDIDTDPWATAAVGNAGWTVNIQHSHTVNNHTHFMGLHTHTLGNHTHQGGSHSHALSSNGYAKICIDADGFDGIAMEHVDVANWSSTRADDAGGPVASGNHTEAAQLGGSTDSAGVVATGVPSDNTSDGPSTNITDGTSPGTDNQLSAAQEIRPSSIRVRYIIRYT